MATLTDDQQSDQDFDSENPLIPRGTSVEGAGHQAANEAAAYLAEQEGLKKPLSNENEDKHSASPGDLGKAEAAAGAGGATMYAGFGGGFWAGGSAATAANNTGGGVKNFFWGTRRRKQASVTTGIAGLTIGGLFFGLIIASGPFEFIHLAQLMTRFHFASLQDASDDRTTKLARYINDAKQGKVENTRLGILGNRFANQIEAKMNTSGIETAYTDKFGNFDGYVIDPENEHFKNMSTDEIKQYFKDSYGVTLTDGAPPGSTGEQAKDLTGKLVASADGLGYFKSRAMVRSMMTEAGYSKISSTIGARIMGRRAGISWHPLKKLDTKVQNALEDWWKNFLNDEENGAAPTEDIQATPEQDKNAQQNQDNATNAQGEADAANSATTEAQQAATAENAGDTNAFSKLTSSPTFKVAGGSLAAIGLACMAQAIADHASQIKLAQQILPVARVGGDTITTGNQVMNGKDANLEELGKLQQNFTDPNSHTSVFQAQSIQAGLGEPQTGPAPNSDFQNLTNDSTPFDALKSTSPGGNILSGFCKATGSFFGQAIGIGLSFLGGPISAAAGLIAGPVVLNPLQQNLAKWLAGRAIDIPALKGAQLGYAMDYGSRLAADQQAIAAGGVALSPTQEQTVNNTEKVSYQQDFDSHNLAYRLFNPYDSQTLASHVIDQVGPSATQDVASLVSGFLHIGSTLLKNISSIFTGITHAQSASTSYDYGFPAFGFSEDDLNNPSLANPYQNAAAAATTLDIPCTNAVPHTPCGQDYIKKAADCFGVSIFQTTATDTNSVSHTIWDVSGGSNFTPLGDKSTQDDCTTPAGLDSNSWRQIRFFIFDTENMQSISCYEGDAASCGAVYFN